MSRWKRSANGVGGGLVSAVFLLLCGLMLLSLAADIGWENRRHLDSIWVLTWVGMSAVIGLLALASVLFSSGRRLIIAIFVTILIICLVSADFFLAPFINFDGGHKPPKVRNEFKSMVEVVLDLRRQGTGAYPHYNPAMTDYQGTTSPNGGLLPLSGVADQTTVLCNGGGSWVLYHSDRHGFRNPPGVWLSMPAEVVLLGDSVVQGWCVEEKDDLANAIRRQHPKTINLAMAGHGPLSMLATLVEYGRETMPQYIVWTFTEESSLQTLILEAQSKRLMAYLDGQGNQGLKAKQRLTDQAVRESQAIQLRKNLQERSLLRDGLRRIRLIDLRRALALTFSSSTAKVRFNGQAELSLLKRVMERASIEAEELGSKLVFVYLPSVRSVSKQPLLEEAHIRNSILKIVENVGLPTIDLTPVFKTSANPVSLFADPESPQLRYNREGYQVVASMVLSVLTEM